MNIQELSKLFDLEYFDGPILSLFADTNGRFFLFKWYDLSSDSHQWLVFEVEFETLSKYLNGNCSELELLSDKNGKLFHLVEFSDRGNPIIVKSLEQRDVLQEFNGLNAVFFRPEMCPNWKAVQQFFDGRKSGRAVPKKAGATPHAPTLTAKFVVSQEHDNLFYFYLVDKGGQVLMKSEAFTSANSAKKGVESVRKLLGTNALQTN